MSLKMLDHLIQSNNLSQIINEYLNEQDWIFVKELIFGPLENLNKTGNGKQFDQWNYKGRPEEKSFLFEVVANKKNGMDVCICIPTYCIYVLNVNLAYLPILKDLYDKEYMCGFGM